MKGPFMRCLGCCHIHPVGFFARDRFCFNCAGRDDELLDEVIIRESRFQEPLKKLDKWVESLDGSAEE